MRSALFIAIIALLGLLLAELACWGFFVFYGAERLQYHLRLDDERFADYFLDPALGAILQKNSDPLTGWYELPADPDHSDVSRINPYSSARSLIATYGDSFTYAQDVADNETWQYYLSALTDTDVANYGARGYGTDQALFRAMNRFAAHGKAPPIVILGILSENIARIVNVSPWYYWSAARTPAVKPVFVEEGGRFVWKNDHLADIATPQGREKVIEAIHQYDFWYTQNRKRPSISFPYTLSALSTIRYFLFDVVRWPDLWRDKRATRTMREILFRFRALSEEWNFTPVVLVIPEIFDLQNKAAGKEAPYASFLKKVRADEELRGLLIVDVFDETFDPARFNIAPYQGHASPYGNRIIAEALYKKLTVAGLVAAPK